MDILGNFGASFEIFDFAVGQHLAHLAFEAAGFAGEMGQIQMEKFAVEQVMDWAVVVDAVKIELAITDFPYFAIIHSAVGQADLDFLGLVEEHDSPSLMGSRSLVFLRIFIIEHVRICTF